MLWPGAPPGYTLSGKVSRMMPLIPGIIRKLTVMWAFLEVDPDQTGKLASDLAQYMIGWRGSRRDGE